MDYSFINELDEKFPFWWFLIIIATTFVVLLIWDQFYRFLYRKYGQQKVDDARKIIFRVKKRSKFEWLVLTARSLIVIVLGIFWFFGYKILCQKYGKSKIDTIRGAIWQKTGALL